MADIVISVVAKVSEYLVTPAIREGQYFLCVKNVINDLQNEKEDLTFERDSLQDRVEQANESGEIIEKPVEKWLDDVKSLLEEVANLEQTMRENNSCFQGWCPTFKRYRLCKQMVEKKKAMEKFKGQSNIQPFSHPAPLPGIQYESSENFIYFESTKVAYNRLMEALQDDRVYMIGVCGMGGCGKTSLVTEVGKKAKGLNMFDKVIPITVSQTPNIRTIQGKLADMLSLELKEESEEGRAQHIWVNLEKKKRVLIIVDDLWKKFELRDVGIRLDDDHKGRWKVLMTTRSQHVCNSMNCQEIIPLGLLSEAESWTLFQKHANIDDMFSKSMNDVPQKLCEECKGLPVAIAAVGSSLKKKSNAEWQVALHSLKHFEATDDHMDEAVRTSFSCLKLSYDYLKNKEAELIFLICSMFPEDYEISIEGLIRFAVGFGLGGRRSLELARSRILASINKLLDSCLLLYCKERESYVKMHDMVRDVALWIATRSEDRKILVNLDKALGSLAEDYSIRDYFAVSSWYKENQISLQLDAPKLEILFLEITSKDSLNISHVTFEGVDELKVFAVIRQPSHMGTASLSLPQSIELLTNLRTVRLNGWHLGDISFITSLTRLEILDLQYCTLNGLPGEMGKLKRLKMLDLSRCVFQENYNGAIGKCLQLEELYAAGLDLDFYSQSIMDIVTHSKLQRFVIGFGGHVLPEEDLASNICTRVLNLTFCDISNLKASKSNLLQIAADVRLSCCHYEGSKNFIPDMIGVVGGMNNLSSLCLSRDKEIECIFDTTCDSDHLGSLQVDALVPKLVALQLSYVQNLKELCRGPSQHVLRFFEKLEKLVIRESPFLQSIFPLECNLQNLKILRIENEYCCNSKYGEVLFSMSVSQSLQQLEELSIAGFRELKHIIASGREHGSNTSKELIPAARNSPSVMPNLKKIMINDCYKLKSLSPICCVEGLVKLKMLSIRRARELKYVFGECDHEDHSSRQYENQIMLPELKILRFIDLENLVGMCPKRYPAKWPSVPKPFVQNCPNFDGQLSVETTTFE